MGRVSVSFSAILLQNALSFVPHLFGVFFPDHVLYALLLLSETAY